MPSINGAFVVVLVTCDQRIQAQRAVSLRTATAVFQDLLAGAYVVIARHPELTPTEARCDVELSENEVFGIRFIYNELERQLLRIETEVSYLP